MGRPIGMLGQVLALAQIGRVFTLTEAVTVICGDAASPNDVARVRAAIDGAILGRKIVRTAPGSFRRRADAEIEPIVEEPFAPTPEPMRFTSGAGLTRILNELAMLDDCHSQRHRELVSEAHRILGVYQPVPDQLDERPSVFGFVRVSPTTSTLAAKQGPPRERVD